MNKLRTVIKQKIKEGFDDAMTTIDGVASEFDSGDEHLDVGFQGEPAPLNDDHPTIDDAKSLRARRSFVMGVRYAGQPPNVALSGGDTLGTVDGYLDIDDSDVYYDIPDELTGEDEIMHVIEDNDEIKSLIAKRSTEILKSHIAEIKRMARKSAYGSENGEY